MRQSGRTMIEMLGVLAIMGVLTIGAITMFTKSRRELSRVSTIQEVSDVSDNIKTLFQGKENYRDLTVSYLIESGVLKNDKNAHGQTFEVSIINSYSGFAIIYDNLSEEDCYFYGLTDFYGSTNILINETSTKDTEKSTDLNCKNGNTNKLSIEFD